MASIYVVQSAFKDGKEENGKPKFYKKGQAFAGADSRVKELMGAGLIAEKKHVEEKEAKEISAQIASKDKEIAELKAKLALFTGGDKKKDK